MANHLVVFTAICESLIEVLQRLTFTLGIYFVWYNLHVIRLYIDVDLRLGSSKRLLEDVLGLLLRCRLILLACFHFFLLGAIRRDCLLRCVF